MIAYYTYNVKRYLKLILGILRFDPSGNQLSAIRQLSANKPTETVDRPSFSSQGLGWAADLHWSMRCREIGGVSVWAVLGGAFCFVLVGAGRAFFVLAGMWRTHPAPGLHLISPTRCPGTGSGCSNIAYYVRQIKFYLICRHGRSGCFNCDLI